MTYPQWTTEITTKGTVTGEDQLGIEGAAQGYQQEILPGIITVTDHARYYSYYPWILYRFIFGEDSKRLLADFRGPYFMRHEMAMLMGTYSHHQNGIYLSGVVGNRKADGFWQSGDPISLDQNYFQNKLGGFGQYYRTAMQVMGILEEPENSRWVYRLTERGKALAEAYQESISHTKYFKDLQNEGQLTQISKEDATEYGQVGCLCPDALNASQDRKLLLDTFFRFSEPQAHDNLHVRRRNSLGVALDLVHHASGRFTRDMLRPALYLGEYAPGEHYSPSEPLEAWAKRWKMVEVRHLFTFGLQCLWAAFLLELGSRISIPRESWQSWLESQLEEKDWNIPVQQLAIKLCENSGVAGNYKSLLQAVPQNFGMHSGQDEYSLYLNARHSQTNSIDLFETGVRILLQLYLRYYSDFKNEDPIWQEMAGRERLPLNDFFKHMENELHNQEWLAKDWLGWIYQQLIFEQHEMIALEKLRYQGYDTFKFYFEDGAFHWPLGKAPYQEPIRLAGNRLFNCITMLTDLGLIVVNEDGEMTLSEDGVEYHQRVLRELQNVH